MLPRHVAHLTLISLLLWSFVGSLAMGLRTPDTTQRGAAYLWLAVALTIAAAGLAIGFLAGRDPEE